METIRLEGELARQIAELAGAQGESVKALVDRALQNYLGEAQRAKIRREMKAFAWQKDELVARHLGQYIAMHEGEVVDQDESLADLVDRIRARYGSLAVLMKRVEEGPDRDLVIRGPRLVHD